MRKFLVSCATTTADGKDAFISFDFKVHDDEKMTSELLRECIKQLKERDGYQAIVPLAFSEERYCCDCVGFRSPSTCLGCGPEITHIENPAVATTCKNFSKRQDSPTIEELDIWIRNAEKQIEFWKKLKREKEETNG